MKRRAAVAHLDRCSATPSQCVLPVAIAGPETLFSGGAWLYSVPITLSYRQRLHKTAHDRSNGSLNDLLLVLRENARVSLGGAVWPHFHTLTPVPTLLQRGPSGRASLSISGVRIRAPDALP